MASRVILVGVGGFGEHFHLPNIRRLRKAGLVIPIALVDPVIRAQSSTSTYVIPTDGPLYDTLAQAIAEVGVPDIVIVSVPIHLHAPIAKEALKAGADVLLEKPPFACMRDFEDVLELEKETGRVVQVGFQSLGSLAIDAIQAEQAILGNFQSVRAMGTWLRRASYWNRSQWVGRRHLGEIDVMDGVATNALAHAVATALHIANIKRIDQVGAVEVEAYRANPIDTDDTTSIRITPVTGPNVVAALTLCASVQTKPTIEIAFDQGIATYEYTTDDFTSTQGTAHYERVDMLENLISHRSHHCPLILPLIDTGAFMCVMEAIRTGGAPKHIEKRWVDQRDNDSDSHPVISDIEHWIKTAAQADSLFSEVGAPWALTCQDNTLSTAVLDDQTIFTILDGAGTAPSSSPRPYIHPVRTLDGVLVTDTHPSDHDWHCGLGFAVPDVNGTSFWGGGTFIKDRGYVMLDNHGSIRHDAFRASPVSTTGARRIDQHLSWLDREDRNVIKEVRLLRWRKLDSIPSHNAWLLGFTTVLTAVNGLVSLGSPGTNGRPGGGYGGFFWRLPRCTRPSIFSADAEGEDAIHGLVSPWLAWSARFEGSVTSTGDATLVFVADDEQSAQDPWVVRNTAYPGIGSAVAWEERVNIPDGDSLRRSFRIAVVDGLLSRQECSMVAGAMRAVQFET
jgi:predicted dehydrogenase